MPEPECVLKENSRGTLTQYGTKRRTPLLSAAKPEASTLFWLYFQHQYREITGKLPSLDSDQAAFLGSGSTYKSSIRDSDKPIESIFIHGLMHYSLIDLEDVWKTIQRFYAILDLHWEAKQFWRGKV